MKFLEELKRRNVIRVGLAYGAAAWLLIQITETVFPFFGMSDAAIRMVFTVLGVGLIPVLIIAWVFELTPEGLKQDKEVTRDSSTLPQTRKRFDRHVTGLLILALSYFVVDKFVLEPSRDARKLEAATEQAIADARPVWAAPKNSIAVLPFTDLSETGDQAYFSTGIAEELLNLLARMPELRVAARPSSFSLQGKDLQVPEIGTLLTVAHVLQGSVSRTAERVRITAMLSSTENGTRLWTETFDRDMSEIFVIQEEISARVIDSLKVELYGAAPTVTQTSPEAYALVLRARQAHRERTPGSLSEAEELLQQALEIAPDYSEAWSGMSEIYAQKAFTDMLSSEEGFRIAREHAQHAISLNPRNAPAHAQLGFIALSTNAPESAALHLQRALEIDPANPDIILRAAALIEMLGRPEEAIVLFRYVTGRDPLNAKVHAFLGRANRVAGHWDAAIASYRTALALSPGHIGSHNGVAESLLLMGNADAALAEYANETDEEWRIKGTALALYTLGRHDEFEATFESLRQRWGEQWPSEIAQVYAWIGDADSAFEWLNKAIVQNEEGLNQQYYRPLNASLRSDPRWAEFRARTSSSEDQLAAIEFSVALP